MTQAAFTAKITFAWWLTWIYLPGVMTLCMFGFQPNEAKFTKTIIRATRVKIVPFPGIKA